MADDEDEMIDYEEEYNPDNDDNMDIEEDKIVGGKYEFLTKDEMDKERQKKIEEFIQYSNLSNSQAEMVLMHYNWNTDILMNDWYDKMQKIKENSGIIQTNESTKHLKNYLKTFKNISDGTWKLQNCIGHFVARSVN